MSRLSRIKNMIEWARQEGEQNAEIYENLLEDSAPTSNPTRKFYNISTWIK